MQVHFIFANMYYANEELQMQGQRSISATSIAIIKVFSVIIKPPLLIILYTIYLKNQAILYNFTIFENIVKSR